MSQKQREKQSYRGDFKDQIIRLVIDNNKPINELSKELDIPLSTIRSWIEVYQKKEAKNKKSDKIKHLEKELKDLKEERDILKKAVAIFSQGPDKFINL
ncbi:transposase [bacterium]